LAIEDQDDMNIHNMDYKSYKVQESRSFINQRTDLSLLRGTIPVYLKTSTNETQLIDLNLRDFDNVITTISEYANIPKSDMNILFYGRILCQGIVSKVQPYDCLSILIKGRGGMLGKILIIKYKAGDITFSFVSFITL
jgi:hypothetical protein